MPSITITAKRLRELLELDGWTVQRRANHGLSMIKRFPDGKTRVTIIPKRGDLAAGTLAAILSSKQTGLTRKGLQALIDRHGL